MSALLEQLAAPSTLWRAWDHVRRRGAGPGVDGLTVPGFDRGAGARLEELGAALRAGRWRPKAARRIRLPQCPDRPIAVSCVADRVVQRALCELLTPRLDPHLSRAAYGYRPRRGVAEAVREVQGQIHRGMRWYVRSDIAGFFEHIDRDALLVRLSDHQVPHDVCQVVRRLVSAQLIDGAGAFDTGVGVAQGSALSPLLSNLFLDPLDRAMLDAGFPFLRYADDLLVLTDTEASTRDALALLYDLVEGLDLQLGARKTRRGHVGGGLVFLGVRFDSAGHRLSAEAWAALAQVASERSDAPLDLADLYALWRRWYGAIDVQAIPSLPVLAAALLGGGASPSELAPLRPALTGPLGAATHLALCAQWQGGEGAACQRALLVEARAALAVGLKGSERQELARCLSLPEHLLDQLPRPQCAPELAAVGAHLLAEAARSLAAPPPEAPSAPPSAEALQWLQRRLRGRARGYHVDQVNGRGHRQPHSFGEAVTAEVLRGHLHGGHRVWVHPVRRDGTIAFACVRFSVRREAMLPPWASGATSAAVRQHWDSLVGLAWDQAMALRRLAAGLDLPMHIEADGGGARVAWLCLDRPIGLRHLYALTRRLQEDLGEPPPELYRAVTPHVDRVRHGAGPKVRLPLGRHPRTRRRSVFLDDQGRPRATLPQETASADQVLRLVRRGPRAHRPPSPALPDRGRAVLRGCGPLRRLAEKAERLHYLSGEERRTLIESLGHLPNTGVATLHALLAPTGWTEAELRGAVGRLSPHPLSCGKVAHRHPALAREEGCDCRFRDVYGGVYPSPVLHGARPWEVAGFEARRRKKKRQAPRVPSASPELRAAVKRWRNVCRQVADATRGLERAEAAVQELMGDRRAVRVQGGLLRRQPGDPPTLEWEEGS